VRLVARDDDRRALLLERCHPGTRLWNAETDQLEISLGLLSRLTTPLRDSMSFRRLRDEAECWGEEIKREVRVELGAVERSEELAERAAEPGALEIRDAQMIPQSGNVGDPSSDHRSVDEEHGKHRPARAVLEGRHTSI
jgi:hypothetical protein